MSTRPLAVSHAFHSPLMRPMLDAFRTEAERCAACAPVLPLVSNVTGAALTEEAPTAAYWVEHVLAPVRFWRTEADDACEANSAARRCWNWDPRPTLLGLGQSRSARSRRTVAGIAAAGSAGVGIRCWPASGRGR